MAIDYGRTRTGIAITDPLGIIAQPYLTIYCSSQRELIKRLKCICMENNVGLILVGNPLRANGQDSEMSEEVRRFAKKLQKALKIKIQLWDERYTSKLALNLSKDHGLKYKNIDQISASLMLEEYLHKKKNVS